MPRRVRIEVEGGLYLVYNRVGQGQRPFADDDEGATFVDLLREVKIRDGFVNVNVSGRPGRLPARAPHGSGRAGFHASGSSGGWVRCVTVDRMDDLGWR